MNYCTLFPDTWHWIIDYDISFLCKIHDELYQAGSNREDADYWFYSALMQYKPEYKALWYLVLIALKKFGWIAWWIHRVPSCLRSLSKRIYPGTRAQMKARQWLEGKVDSFTLERLIRQF